MYLLYMDTNVPIRMLTLAITYNNGLQMQVLPL